MNANTVVVAIDGSRSSWGAFHWAAAEAQRTGRRLVVVHSGDTNPVAGCVDEQLSYGRALLEDAVEKLVESYPSLPSEVRLLNGDAVHELLELSRFSDLIVVGRGRNGPPSLLLGAVARRVLASAHCPTVVVPRASKPTDNRIVVGAAGTPGGAAALHFAFGEATMRGAEVVPVWSWSPFEWQLAGYGATLSPNMHEELEREAFAAALEPMRHEFPKAVVHPLFSSEPVDVALRRQAKGAVALVLGCRRSDEAVFGRIGPIASWAVKHYDVPIAVVGHAPQREAKDMAGSLDMVATFT